MNKYAAIGLTEAANAGRRILVLTAKQALARETLDELLHVAPDPDRVSRANGSESIRYSTGGRIDIRSANGQVHRGLAVDTVYLDTDVDHTLRDTHVLASIAACTATSTTGEIIRA